MEFKQLQYFLTVSECGSLSRAASILGVAQPALSRQIARLERDLANLLFYRHGRGMRLTQEGEHLKASVSPIMRELMQIRADLREHARVPAGAISFGMPPSLSAAIGAETIGAFNQRFPQVKLHIMDGFSGFVHEWLASGRVDMAIVNNARKPSSICMDPLLCVDLFLFGRRENLEAFTGKKTTFKTAGLADLPLLLVGRNHGLRRDIDGAMRKLGVKPDIKVEIDSLSALTKLVRNGDGFTVLPRGAISTDGENCAVGHRRLVSPSLTQRFSIAYSLERPTTIAMRELARVVREEVKAGLASGRLVGWLADASSYARASMQTTFSRPKSG